ncbi:hypothetical protein Cgig2_023429 [Carnegiea gigantea]|uniref:Uncharacterized protein n=1 Tax=Carnegiea gigantea TaxID=171969 RepID=A0A9Q1K4B8_9CARY|nr:hypothetical protein Cgig2_023429 [Carnegiea gigantea]
MASLELKPPDPRHLGPPVILYFHGQIPHLLKVIDTRLLFFQSSKLGSVLETMRFHRALGMEILEYDNYKPLCMRHSCCWSTLLQLRSEIANSESEIGASCASIVTVPNHLQQITTKLNRCEGYMYVVFPSITLQMPTDLLVFVMPIVNGGNMAQVILESKFEIGLVVWKARMCSWPR